MQVTGPGADYRFGHGRGTIWTGLAHQRGAMGEGSLVGHVTFARFHARARSRALVALAAGLVAVAAVAAPAGAARPGRAPAAVHAATTSQWVDSWGASFLSTTVNGVAPVRSELQQPDVPAQRLLEARRDAGPGEVVEQVRDQHAEGRRRARRAAIDQRTRSRRRPTATLTFGGQPGVTLAAGAEVWSDPVTLTVAQHVTVAVSVYVPGQLQADDVPPDRAAHELPLALRQLHRVDDAAARDVRRTRPPR